MNRDHLVTALRRTAEWAAAYPAQNYGVRTPSAHESLGMALRVLADNILEVTDEAR